MEKKQDDARNTETEKKPEAAGRQGQPGSAAPDKVTDVELANEKTTPEKATTHTGKTDTTTGKPVSGAAGGSVPPVDAGKDNSNAGKGTKGPLIAAVVVVAAIAAGGYYYAQNNQSESGSSSQTASEPASSAPAEAPAADAEQPGQQPATDATSGSSDIAGNAESGQSADSTAASPIGASAHTDVGEADKGESSGDAASAAQDEASGSTSSTPAGPTATNNESVQSQAESTGNVTAQSSSDVANENTPGDASADAASTADVETPATAADKPQASGASPAPGSGTGGFTSLPADIRDQLDRQSAQIIALRDQLESSQKQLQQLQTTRLQASRDETTLFVVNDVSRLVTMGQNELAIAGNVENAVTSLETAIKAIDQADSPVLAGLRGALAADIVTLKSAPALGVDAQFAQLAALSGKIEALPMLAPDQAGAKPMAGQSSEVATPATDTAEVASSDTWYERAWSEVKTWPGAAWNGLRSDLGGIVRVEKLADPNQVLLTVDQAAHLRANLQQHLHFAQQALLNGQQGIWTSSLETVVKGIKQSFNQDSVETQQVLAQLQQLLKAGVRQQLPPITQSVKAVQETRKQLKSMNPGQE